MELSEIALLVGAGLATGFLAALVGIGGGVVFAPVLFFFFRSRGVPDEVVTGLTLGTSLFCTVVAAAASAYFQQRRGAVEGRVALRVGLLSAVAVFVMVRWVTTQPWYDATAFQLVFGTLLLVVVARMVRKALWPGVPTTDAGGAPTAGARAQRWPLLAGIGTAAGVVSAAAGVGGGVVLVPLYHGVLRLPMATAVGTSSATIVFISSLGVLNYAAMGLGAAVPGHAVGYVDVLHGLLLALPTLATARLGVWVAHRIDTRWLRVAFAAVAAYAAVRLLMNAL